MTHWTNGEHAMALKAERERVWRKMSIELADWQASSEAYRLDAETKAAEVEQLRAALKDVIDDIHDYEQVNNLAPNPPRMECWDSVARARAALEPKP